MTDKQKGPIFNPEGVNRLLAEGGGEDLNDDERALILALIGIATETGRELTEKEQAAMDKIKAQVEGYDAEELTQAVQRMITSQPKESRKLEWPKLKMSAHEPEQGE